MSRSSAHGDAIVDRWEGAVKGTPAKRPDRLHALLDAVPRASDARVAFALWAVAFYATAMAYVFQGRGVASTAVAMALLAFGCLLPLLLPALHARR